MKKFLSIILIIITFLIIYFLQSNFFNGFKILNIKPNLFIVFMMLIGLFLGKEYGFFWGIAFGMIIDLFIGKNIGVNAISLGTAGFMAGVLENNLSKESRFSVMIITIILTFISELVAYIMQVILNSGTLSILAFFKIMLIEILYNVIVVIIIYSKFRKFGEYLENILYDRHKIVQYY